MSKEVIVNETNQKAIEIKLDSEELKDALFKKLDIEFKDEYETYLAFRSIQSNDVIAGADVNLAFDSYKEVNPIDTQT